VVAPSPTRCRWDKTLVVFNGNSLKTGIPLEHIQGQIESVSGWSDGRLLEVQGILKLASVMFLGQQITEVQSPFHVKQGAARLDNISGSFLKGQLWGEGEVSLDTTPHYRAAFSLEGAQLEEYARTVAGRQSFRGLASARIEINGLGSDIRTLSGQGDAHITQGDLGELPPVLRIAKALNGLLYLDQALAAQPRASGKTADFDSADVAFRIAHGSTVFDSIKFTGNAFSLKGQGTMDPQCNLDLKLDVLWGRDRFHVPLLSEVAREASTSLFVVRVQGTPSAPQVDPEPLPPFSDLLRALKKNRARRQAQ
jgi:AsmA-like C-terminal region